MDFETIKQNLLNALNQILQMRLIVSSPHELVADLPLLYVLVALLMSKYIRILFLIVVVLGFVCRYSARIERDLTRA